MATQPTTHQEIILLVEDDQGLAELIVDIMGSIGCACHYVSTGGAALGWLKSNRPDLILLDVMMPKKSGFEVCEALRADPARSGLKIIMLTAKGRDTEMAKGLALGADAYMTKPFSTKDLIARIREVLAA